MIRLFTALIIPEEIKQKLLSTCHSLVDNPEQYRWVVADKIHLTLKFIGEVEEDLTEPIKDELTFAEEFKHFDCSISRFGFFFRNGEPKILWMGSIPVEKRRFKPHLTMLRLKQDPGEEFIQNFKEHSFEEIKFNLKTFALVKSELFQTGAQYTEIKKYNLK
jgi:2'-5' RNA ligase